MLLGDLEQYRVSTQYGANLNKSAKFHYGQFIDGQLKVIPYLLLLWLFKTWYEWVDFVISSNIRRRTPMLSRYGLAPTAKLADFLSSTCISDLYNICKFNV